MEDIKKWSNEKLQNEFKKYKGLKNPFPAIENRILKLKAELIKRGLKENMSKNLHENRFKEWMSKYHLVTIEESSINMKDYEVQFAARWQAVNDLLTKLQGELSRDGHTDAALKFKDAIDRMKSASNDVTSLIAQAVKDFPQDEEPKEEPKDEPKSPDQTSSQPSDQNTQVITGGQNG